MEQQESVYPQGGEGGISPANPPTVAVAAASDMQAVLAQLRQQQFILEDLQRDQRKLRRSLRLMTLGTYLRLFLVFLPLLGGILFAYFYLPQKLGPIIPQMQQILPTLQNLNTQAGAVSDVFSSFSPDQAKQVQGILQMLQ